MKHKEEITISLDPFELSMAQAMANADNIDVKEVIETIVKMGLQIDATMLTWEQYYSNKRKKSQRRKTITCCRHFF